MNTTTHLMTADELLVMPHHESGNDYHYELLRGELKKMAPAGGTHGIICMSLALRLAYSSKPIISAQSSERKPDLSLSATPTRCSERTSPSLATSG